MDRLRKRQPIIVTTQVRKIREAQAEQLSKGLATSFTIIGFNEEKVDIFYILFHPQGGPFDGQKHVIEFKTLYGSGDSPADKYYFPANPPNIKFLTNIYHSNISMQGSVCLDILKDASKWSQLYTIETVILTMIGLLDSPNTSSPLNSSAAKHWAECVKNKDFSSYIEHGLSIANSEDNIKTYNLYKTQYLI